MAGRVLTVGTGLVGSGTEYSDFATAWAAAQSGFTIRVFPGTYDLPAGNPSLSSVAGSVTIEGVGGPSSVVLRATDTTNGGVIFDLNHTGITFKSLTVMGASSNTTCDLINCVTNAATTTLISVNTMYQATHTCKLNGVFLASADCRLLGPYNTLASGAFLAEKVAWYGTGALTANHLYYMAAAGGAWTLANATATGSGDRKLLGITMGDSSLSGIMLRGYHFIEAAQLTGAWVDGGHIWMDTTAGHFAADASQPVAAGNVSRYLGDGTNQANTFYFNPDGAAATA